MSVVCVWLLAWVVKQCYGNVIIIATHSNETYSPVPDYPAKFGPPLPLSGFKGYATYVDPHHACTKPKPPPFVANFTGPFIGIIKRNNCSFVDKVINAQRAGYDAVIVHNVNSNDLQPMGTNSDAKAAMVVIPSVFIGQDDATMIIENFLYDKGFILKITDDFPFNLQSYLVPFAITIGICFIVMLVFMIVKCVRDYRRSRRHRLSSRALRKLPTHKFKKGDPYECCAICLEDYVDNDKLRILPCEHAYHSKCIDPWLTKNRRVCPVCKRKVFTGDERPSDHDTDSEDEGSPLINSEGGTQGGTFTPQRENPFQEAEREAEERRQRRQRRRGISRHVECGPEGYQRLAESSEEDDDEDEVEQEEDEEEVTKEKGTEATEQECADEGECPEAKIVHPMCVVPPPHVTASSSPCTHHHHHPSPHCPPSTISVLVHDMATNAAALTDTSSLSSDNSVGSQGSPPGPVQIAVDVVNSPPPSITTHHPTSSSPSPSHASTHTHDNRSERDYVV